MIILNYWTNILIKGKRKWFLAQNHCSLKNDQIFLEPLLLGFFTQNHKLISIE